MRDDLNTLQEYICRATEAAANALMNAEATALVKAGHYERSGARTAYRNGYRARRWHTSAGGVLLHIPKLRSGSYYPAFLTDEAAAEDLFAACAVRALVGELTPADVAPLLTDPTYPDIAEQVTQAFDAAAHRYLTRPLRRPYPVLHIEREQDKLFIYGERPNGARALLDVRAVEGGTAFWQAVLRKLAGRGLVGVRAVQGSAAGDSVRQAARTVFLRDVVAALGVPLGRPAIDRARPHGLLHHAVDATLTIVIDGKTLVHLRRLLRDERDAVGEPLRRAA